jgi:ABC-type dipeptide/oligopeptide/nickel transport system permease component
MEGKATLIEPLLERVQEYSKTSFELLKLKSLDKTADVASTLISRSLLTIVLSLFALTLNIALSLWLGDVLGKNYYGFLVVASFYGLAAIILFFIHPVIKAHVSNSIITQIRN